MIFTIYLWVVFCLILVGLGLQIYTGRQALKVQGMPITPRWLFWYNRVLLIVSFVNLFIVFVVR